MKHLWTNGALLFLLLIQVTYSFDLVILHTNDVHSHFVEFNVYGGRCPSHRAKENKCFGGFARQITKINEIRKNKRNVIFLNGGDFFQGTVWYTLYKYEAVAKFVNELTIDAMSLGNHEFDDGTKGLIPYLKIVKTPVVVCNMNATDEPELQNLIKPSTILEVGGEKIGVIGYLTPETKVLSKADKVTFTDEVDCIRKEVKRLKQKGINKIIAVGHAGYLTDLDIARKVPEIDVVVGGHTNTFLYTGTPPSIEKPQNLYPTVIARADNSKALVVQDFAYGKYLGYLEVSFTKEGLVKKWKGNPILLNGTVPQDPTMLKLLQPYANEVQNRGKEEVGQSNVLLRGDKCRLEECNLGNLLTDASIDYFITGPTEKGWTNVAVALWNSGGIRGSIDEQINGGSVILEDLLTIAPFSDKLDMIVLKGKHLREVLEHSVKNYNSLDPGGNFLQVSGLRIVYNVSNPAGARVKSVQIRCAECRIPKLEPLQEEHMYRIIMPRFLVEGGDGFSMIPEHAQNIHNSGTLDIDIIMKFMKKMRPIIYGIENRITIIGRKQ